MCNTHTHTYYTSMSTNPILNTMKRFVNYVTQDHGDPENKKNTSIKERTSTSTTYVSRFIIGVSIGIAFVYTAKFINNRYNNP